MKSLEHSNFVRTNYNRHLTQIKEGERKETNLKLFEKEAIEGPTKVFSHKSNIVVTCTKKGKRTCGVKRCTLAKCVGCKWSNIDKKRSKS